MENNRIGKIISFSNRVIDGCSESRFSEISRVEVGMNWVEK